MIEGYNITIYDITLYWIYTNIDEYKNIYSYFSNLCDITLKSKYIISCMDRCKLDNVNLEFCSNFPILFN